MSSARTLRLRQLRPAQTTRATTAASAARKLRSTIAVSHGPSAADAIKLLEWKDPQNVPPPKQRLSHRLISKGKLLKWRPVQDKSANTYVIEVAY